MSRSRSARPLSTEATWIPCREEAGPVTSTCSRPRGAEERVSAVASKESVVSGERATCSP
jgi:hypothetical protein